MTERHGPFSRNELEFYMTRAAVGAGAPFGVAEDAARIALGLAGGRVDAGAVFACALRRLDSGDSSGRLRLRTGARGETEITSADGKPLSAVFAAPAVEDWLAGHDGGRNGTLVLRRVDCPLLAAAAVAARNKADGADFWRFRAAGSGRDAPPAAAGGPESGIAGCSGPAKLVVSPETEKSGPATAAHPPSSGQGLFLHARDWACIRTFFARCLVPSTEMSRQDGAGPAAD